MYLKVLGSRLQYIRKQAGLSREYIEKVHNIPAVTVRSWELLGPDIGIYKLVKYIDIYKDYGIDFSMDALLDDNRDFALEDSTSAKEDARFISSTMCDYLMHTLGRVFFYANSEKEVLYISKLCRTITPSHLDSRRSRYALHNIIPDSEYSKCALAVNQVLRGNKASISYVASKNSVNLQVELTLAPNFDLNGLVIGFCAISITDPFINFDL